MRQSGLIRASLSLKQEEPVDDHEFINADILFFDKDNKEDKFLLEIDGPGHFITEKKVRTCHDILRKNALRSLGYKVVTLSFIEWEKLDFDNKAKNLLLIKKVDPQSYEELKDTIDESKLVPFQREPGFLEKS